MTSVELRNDDPVVTRLTRAAAALEPDQQFRRRLRGVVLNRHVAVREGLAVAAPPRQMGRLGRSVLIASVVLAASVGSVGAASQQALPGDPLYGVKRQIEEIRLRVAPVWMHDALELVALDERLDEVEQLAAEQRWSDLRVAAEEAVETRLELSTVASPIANEALAEHVSVLHELLDEVPDAGRKGIERAISASQADGRPAATPAHPDHPAHPEHAANPIHPPQAGEPAEPTRPPQAGEPAEPTRPPQAGQPAEPTRPPQAGQPAQPTHQPH